MRLLIHSSLFSLFFIFTRSTLAFAPLRPALLRRTRATNGITSRSATLPMHMAPLPFLDGAFQALPDFTISKMQAAGETTFAASALVAVIQGALIMHQYATNPSRFLMAPPGLTIGVEDASTATVKLLGEDLIKNTLATETEINFATVSQPATGSTPIPMKDVGWSQANKFMVVLLPWLMRQTSFTLMRYNHLVHIGAIMSLVRIYDFFHKLPELQEDHDSTASPFFSKERPNVMVIGDSMSVGIGCVHAFDQNKDSTILKKTERLELSPNELKYSPTGPIFPKVLAQTLSQRLNTPVLWRSAGVDGGDTTDIREYLLDSIQEEADQGRPPDVVVVLTGANDLKRIISIFPNSKPCASVRGFRSNLLELVQDIQKIAPKAKVVFPALPTYRLDSNSCLNVFPLNFFLDALLGFWDSQKIRVADKSRNVYYFGLTVEEVNDWYREERSKGNMEPTLLSIDGIHPNGNCYAKWGRGIGNKLADTIEEEEKQIRPTQDSKRNLSVSRSSYTK